MVCTVLYYHIAGNISVRFNVHNFHNSSPLLPPPPPPTPRLHLAYISLLYLVYSACFDVLPATCHVLVTHTKLCSIIGPSCTVPTCSHARPLVTRSKCYYLLPVSFHRTFSCVCSYIQIGLQSQSIVQSSY